jgi:hypothetical protein
VPVAVAVLEFYKSGETNDGSGNVVSTEQGRGLLDQTMWDVWKGHGNHIQIHFQYKLERQAPKRLWMFSSKRHRSI